MVPAVIATGLVKLSCCQPCVVSLVNVPVASIVPVALHSVPVWVPMFAWLL